MPAKIKIAFSGTVQFLLCFYKRFYLTDLSNRAFFNSSGDVYGSAIR